MHNIFVVGLGPGEADMMTPQAAQALDAADVIVGYTGYLQLLGDAYKNKALLSTPMRRERERCRLCFLEAEKGKTVAMVCSGDAGIYGMASLMYEVGEDFPDAALTIVPGITAAISGAAQLGAPLGHDFCVISLSDALTPWETIARRLAAAAAGDFALAIYNPASKSRPNHLRRACDILLAHIGPARPCGYVENIGRPGTKAVVCTLGQLKNAQLNMFTTVFVGNSQTRILNGKLVTGRNYAAAQRGGKNE